MMLSRMSVNTMNQALATHDYSEFFNLTTSRKTTSGLYNPVPLHLESLPFGCRQHTDDVLSCLPGQIPASEDDSRHRPRVRNKC